MKIILYKIMLKRKLSIRQVSILTGVSKSTIQKTMAELSNLFDKAITLGSGAFFALFRSFLFIV
jgi:predicted DNA-binding transcriptional regulator AlpA